MSSLTDEQRRRIEENRLKAIERRMASMSAQRQQANQPDQTAQTSNLQSKPNNQINQFQLNNANPKATTYSVFNNQSSVRPTQQTSQQWMNKPPTMSSAPLPKNDFLSAKVMTATCVLISRERFLVEMGFNKNAIEIFKSIKGASYDPTTKKWNFPISEHSNLIKAIEPLKPNIVIGAIPANVLKILQNTSISKRIPDVDFSRIDPVLISQAFPFQKEGIAFGISRGGRVLLADDMGLGKTIQALGIAHNYYSEWPLLIVGPSSMKYNWREAIWNWLPSVAAGSIAIMETTKDPIPHSKVVILSYDLLQRRAQEFQNYKVIIVDESHNIKNFKTARSKAISPIVQSAKRAILLSGTPALSRPMELYNQISSINRSLFSNPLDYGIRYCNSKKTSWGWDHSGSSNLEELKIVLEESLMIRRLKCDVLSQLPAKIRQMMIIDSSLVSVKSKSLQMSAAAYTKSLNENPQGMEKRGRLLEYYAQTAEAKIDGVREYIKELVESEKKFLCFAHHRVMLDAICLELESLKCKYIRIDGSTNASDRKTLVDKFQFHESVLVAVLSITAANSGITLTSAHLVLFAELFWNPGILTQAEDRAHRIGQEDSVLVQYLVARGTADDVLWPLLQEKLDVLNKGGLSKDNFREADATNLMQKSVKQEKQPTIDQFFAITGLTDEDLACLEGDFSDFLDSDTSMSETPPGPCKKSKSSPN